MILFQNESLESEPRWGAPAIGACVYLHAGAPVIEETWR